MTTAEIEELIIAALADQAGCDPGELRMRLECDGEQMPIDSLLAAEVLTEVEELCGVSLPATAEAATALTSVATFAAAVHELLASEAASA